MNHHIFKNVLSIGPINKYGGMGAVIGTYQKNIENFNFFPSYKRDSLVRSSFFYLKCLLRVVIELIINKEILIIHIHSASKGSFYRKSIISLLSKLFGKKVIFHIHSGSFNQFYHKSFFRKYFIKKILNYVDIVICLSNDWLQFYQNELSLKNVFVLGNPVNIVSSDISVLHTNKLNLLFLGAISDNKGIFDLIHYLHSNIYFLDNRIDLFIGGIGASERLNRLIEESEYIDRLHYLGWVSDENKHTALKQCDIFILPSYFEGLPVSILEAIGYGKPIIASNVGGNPSIVKNNTNGWLFDPNQFEQLDIIFHEIFTNFSVLPFYQANSLKIADQFSTESVLTKLSTMYESLILK